MSKIAKATLGIMIVTMLSKVLGLGREMVLGAYYSVGDYSQIYLMSMNIVSTLFTIVASAVVTTFIPLYLENYNLGSDEQGNNFANNIINIVVIICSLIIIFGLIFTKQLVSIFAPGYEGDKLLMTVKFTRIVLAGGLFISLSRIMSSFLQAKEKFTVSSMSGIPFNIIIIISIVLSSKYNIYILPIGGLLAMMSQYIFQLIFASKNGYKYKRVLNINDEYVKRMIILLGPVLVGVIFNQINTIIDKSIATTIGDGSGVSALTYANRLNGFVMGLFITSIASVIYPILSNYSSSDNKKGFNRSIVKSVNGVLLLVIPVSVGAIVLSKPIVRILFQRGAFDEVATNMTAISLIFYSFGMVAFGLKDILGKVFYSLQDTKTPVINGIISVIINIVLNIILSRFMGYAGLAFATSVATTICIFLLFNSLKKRLGNFGQSKIISVTLKSIFSAIIMGVFTYFTYEFMTSILGIGFVGDFISLAVSVIVGVVIYAIFIILLKVEEVSILVDIVNKKFIRKLKRN